MLGCEYGCKDAVEVLLRNSADVTLVDALGHDCSYYARIGDNVDILTLVKAAVEDSTKGMKWVLEIQVSLALQPETLNASLFY